MSTEIPSKARVIAIAEMMQSVGMYTQAREVEALGNRLEKLEELAELVVKASEANGISLQYVAQRARELQTRF